MTETQATINYKPNTETIELLTKTRNILSDIDAIRPRLHELIEQGEGFLQLKDVHPIFQSEEYKYFANKVGAYYNQYRSLDAVTHMVGLAHEIETLPNWKLEKKKVLPCRKQLIEYIDKLIKEMNAFDEELSGSRDYEFTDEQKTQLKKAITDYLKDEGYETVEVAMANSVTDITEVTFSITPYAEQGDDYSGIYEQLIDEQKFSKGDIELWLYENNKDSEWYEDYFPYGTAKNIIADNCQGILEDLKAVEFQQFIDNIGLMPSYNLSDIAERIEKDFACWLEGIDKNLRVEHLQASPELREVIYDDKDFIYCYKGFPEGSDILKGVEWTKIAKGIVDNHSSSAVAKSLMNDFLTWSGEKGDFKIDENNLQDKLVDYIRSRFDAVQERVLKDHALTQDIIPLDALFEVKDVWIFNSRNV